jgi:hypothetical protein
MLSAARAALEVLDDIRRGFSIFLPKEGGEREMGE